MNHHKASIIALVCSIVSLFVLGYYLADVAIYKLKITDQVNRLLDRVDRLDERLNK